MSMKRTVASVLRAVLPVLLLAAALWLLSAGLRGVEAKSDAEGLSLLDHAIRRAAVQCYAIEGRYPPTLDYLERQYGLQLDRSAYIVHYTLFAENLFPDITIIPVFKPGAAD